MKVIFYTYCFTYIVISIAMSYLEIDSITLAKSLAALSIISIGFICLAPLAVVINPDLIKSSNSDSKYMNFCLIAGGLRIILWAISIMGLRDHMTLLFLNAFGLSIFALLESRFKRISNEYFKY